VTLDRRSFLALGAFTLVGCSSTLVSTRDPSGSLPPLSEVPGGPTSVVMVGDSITEGSTPSLTAAFHAIGIAEPRIEGKAKRRIEVGNGKGGVPLSGVKQVYSLLSEGLHPDAWVIELGTNDVGSYAKPDDYGALIDEIVVMLPADARLVWVNTYRSQYLDATKVFNLVLVDRMQRRGKAVVADWFGVASAKNESVLSSDGLHPNKNGQNALALLVVQALQRL
jgi:lysophospholipase L1-like esterase